MRELWVFLYSTTRYGGSHRCVDMMIYHFTGHPQQEHETRHGSMSHTRTVNGPDHTAVLVEGRGFFTNDEGFPMACNMLCQALDRHTHIDYCRSDNEATVDYVITYMVDPYNRRTV